MIPVPQVEAKGAEFLLDLEDLVAGIELLEPLVESGKDRIPTWAAFGSSDPSRRESVPAGRAECPRSLQCRWEREARSPSVPGLSESGALLPSQQPTLLWWHRPALPPRKSQGRRLAGLPPGARLVLGSQSFPCHFESNRVFHRFRRRGIIREVRWFASVRFTIQWPCRARALGYGRGVLRSTPRCVVLARLSHHWQHGLGWRVPDGR